MYTVLLGSLVVITGGERGKGCVRVARRGRRGKVPWAKAGVNVYSYLCLSQGETGRIKDSVAVGSTAAVIKKYQSTIVVLTILTILTCQSTPRMSETYGQVRSESAPSLVTPNNLRLVSRDSDKKRPQGVQRSKPETARC
jgi:hypothetical protein